MPEQVEATAQDLKYPKAWGHPDLRAAIASYYQTHYQAPVDPENVMVFAGGRPGLVALLSFLQTDIEVRIAETEYTPYWDMLKLTGRSYTLVDSGEANGFRPSVEEYFPKPKPKPKPEADGKNPSRSLVLLSNPCNPTGQTQSGEEMKTLVQTTSQSHTGLLVDEAYEMFHHPPVSALEHVEDLDSSNLFVSGAATKGLQAPGIRIGWVIASRSHIEVLGNFSSFGMGGVSHLSQLYALSLLEENRVAQARQAVPDFYGQQRKRYGEAFADLGLELHTGEGGFYHWCRLPGGMTAEEFNRRLFPTGAAILKGTDCDMARRGDASPLCDFIRFSFGPLAPDSFEEDIRILRAALAGQTVPA